jgi:hypothetical protein
VFGQIEYALRSNFSEYLVFSRVKVVVMFDLPVYAERKSAVVLFQAISDRSN